MQEEKNLTEQVEQAPVRQELLSVTFNDGKYEVKIPKGSNVAETAFCMAVIIKVLTRDNIVSGTKEVLDAITRYLDDPQFEEVKE
uniref:Uncharacterized protein n=1 Tax=Podoviridae sp. ctaNW81 TaxID=2826562 RepID=A0A8S5M5Q9_9CAUD|nr:MAG TPA: hypothetical protein [Podoviridae sp. ctaNW81]